MDLDFLPFKHSELPAEKTFDIKGVNYAITIRYNDRFDFYTAEISDNGGNLLFTGKLTYNRNLIDAVVPGIDPTIKIIPIIIEDAMREFPVVTRIGKDNFDSVSLVVL